MDGVFIPNQAEISNGSKQIKVTYSQLFKLYKLNVKFTIEEINIYGEIAFMRVASKGEQITVENNEKKTVENREFILLKKVNKNWKIFRYMFN